MEKSLAVAMDFTLTLRAKSGFKIISRNKSEEIIENGGIIGHRGILLCLWAFWPLTLCPL